MDPITAQKLLDAYNSGQMSLGPEAVANLTNAVKSSQPAMGSNAAMASFPTDAPPIAPPVGMSDSQEQADYFANKNPNVQTPIPQQAPVQIQDLPIDQGMHPEATQVLAHLKKSGYNSKDPHLANMIANAGDNAANEIKNTQATYPEPNDNMLGELRQNQNMAYLDAMKRGEFDEKPKLLNKKDKQLGSQIDTAADAIIKRLAASGYETDDPKLGPAIKKASENIVKQLGESDVNYPKPERELKTLDRVGSQLPLHELAPTFRSNEMGAPTEMTGRENRDALKNATVTSTTPKFNKQDFQKEVENRILSGESPAAAETATRNKYDLNLQVPAANTTKLMKQSNFNELNDPKNWKEPTSSPLNPNAPVAQDTVVDNVSNPNELAIPYNNQNQPPDISGMPGMGGSGGGSFKANVDLNPRYVKPGMPKELQTATDEFGNSVGGFYDKSAENVSKQSVMGQADAAEMAQRTANLNKELDAQDTQMDEHRKQRLVKSQSALDNLNRMSEQLGEYKEDPNHYWNSKSTGEKILAGIGMILGGAGGGLARTGKNPAMDVINQGIEKDIEAQRATYGAKKNSFLAKNSMYGQMVNHFKDEESAENATKVMMFDQVQRQIKQISMNSASEAIKLKAQQALNEIEAKKKQAQYDFVTRQYMLTTPHVGVGGSGGGLNDKAWAKLNEQTKDLEKDLAHNKVFENDVVISDFDNLLNSMPVGSSVNNPEQRNVVSRGLRAATDWIGGEGTSIKTFDSPEEQIQQSNTTRLQNQLTYALSGLQLSNEEFLRRQKELNRISTREGFENFRNGIVRENEQRKKSVYAGYDPAIVQMYLYRKNGGGGNRGQQPINVSNKPGNQ